MTSIQVVPVAGLGLGLAACFSKRLRQTARAGRVLNRPQVDSPVTIA